MQKNTGQLYEEQRALEFLRKQGIEFSDDDIGRTLSYIQIPTNFSDQDVDSLIKTISPINGEVKLKDGVAYIYIKHHRDTYPLWQQGVFFIFLGVTYYYTLYYFDEITFRTLSFFL